MAPSLNPQAAAFVPTFGNDLVSAACIATFVCGLLRTASASCQQ